MNNKYEYKLHWKEMQEAAMVGIKRNISAIYHKRKDVQGSNHRWEDNVVGAIGEYVVAKHFGFEWNGSLGDLGARDVKQFEVKATSYPNGNLLLPLDKVGRTADEDIFILVTGSTDEMTWTIRGWCTGKYLKNAPIKDPHGGRPYHFVHRKELRSMEELTI